MAGAELTREGLYTAYREKVLAYLLEKIDRPEDAEDLCEDVFEQIARSLPRFDPEKASVSTWIYRITRYTLTDYYRTNRPTMPLPEELPAADDPEAQLLRQETLARLAELLSELETQQRDILVLRYYEDYSLTKIAALTGISYGMVKVKHRQALKALQAKLN